MHGVTKEVTLDVEGPSRAAASQGRNLRVGASATTTINRSDFGLQYNRMVEATPVVSDEVQDHDRRRGDTSGSVRGL